MKQNVKVALIQTSPVLFDREGTLVKVRNKTEETSAFSPDLILFPEAFVPAYPDGLTFGAPVGSRSEEGRELWLRYWKNSIEIPGPDVEVLSEIARMSGTYLAIGVIEKENIGKGSLYCTLLYIGPDGKLLGKHRKIKPTAAERIIWAEGDGSTLTTLHTEIGVIGGLICWENYMPLARFAMYQKGVNIYLAPTADQRDTWQATMRHIACEGRCFVLGCNQYITKDMYPDDLPGIEDLDRQPHVLSRGGSVVVDPFGKAIAGPLFDEEGIIYAELDMDVLIKAKMDFDPIGHYNRPDIFKFKARKQPPTIDC